MQRILPHGTGFFWTGGGCNNLGPQLSATVDAEGLLEELPGCEWEDVLLEWFEGVFISGKAPATGAKTVSALLGAAPHLGRPLSRVFPRLMRALRGWNCRSPGFSRPPIPWIVACGLCRRLLVWKRSDFALGVLLVFTAYLRPSELLAMRSFQLVPPGPHGDGGFQRWTLLIHPVDLQVPGKTGEVATACRWTTRAYGGSRPTWRR